MEYRIQKIIYHGLFYHRLEKLEYSVSTIEYEIKENKEGIFNAKIRVSNLLFSFAK